MNEFSDWQSELDGARLIGLRWVPARRRTHPLVPILATLAVLATFAAVAALALKAAA